MLNYHRALLDFLSKSRVVFQNYWSELDLTCTNHAALDPIHMSHMVLEVKTLVPYVH
jgi:hypothetical protein